MKFDELEAAWHLSKDKPYFYNAFFSLTGLTKEDLEKHFSAWNRLTHEEAMEVSRKHGQDRPNFRAYLAEVTQS